MRIRVLGAAAGGAFPQWNAHNPQCRRARAGDSAAPPQTQASVAVEGGDGRWFLLNASPDLRQQIESNPPLQPGAGQLTLRERQPLSLYATARVLATLRANRIFDVLAEGVVSRNTIVLDRAEPLTPPDGAVPALTVEAFAVPGKAALYLEDAGRADLGTEPEDTIGLIVRKAAAPDAAFAFIPGCAAVTPALKARLRGLRLVFFDGTLYRDDEMIRSGEGAKTGQRMGHVSMSGAEGAIAALADLDVGRKVFIHINNTNPVLLADSPERRAVEAAGWSVARDGMEIAL